MTKEVIEYYIILLLLFCFIQGLYGLCQYIGLCPSNHAAFKITGSFENPAGFSACLVAGAPFCFYYFHSSDIRKKYLAYFFFIFMFILIVLSESRAGILAISIAFAIYILRIKNKRIKRWKYLLFISMMILLFLGMYFIKKDSADGRILIWKCTTEMIKEKSLFGYGFKSFNTQYMPYQAEYFKNNPENNFEILADNVKHPFNEFLLLMSEHGLIGVLGVFLIIISLLKLLPKNNKFLVFTILSSLLSVFVFSGFSYPFKYPFTWIVVFFSITSLIALGDQKIVSISKQKMQLFNFIITGLSGIFLYFSLQLFRHEKEWCEITKKSIEGQTQSMIPKYKALYRPMSQEPLFVYNYAAELNYIGEFQASLVMSKKCEDILNDYDVQMLLAYNYLELKNDDEAEKHFLLAKHMCPNRFMPLYRLALIYEKNNRMKEFKNLANKILQKPVKIESETITLIKLDIQKRTVLLDTVPE